MNQIDPKTVSEKRRAINEEIAKIKVEKAEESMVIKVSF